MSAAAHAHAEHAHHSPFHYDYDALNRLGLWLFFASETMIFIVLLVVRFSLAGTSMPEHLDQVLGLGITIVLLASSLTAYRAESAIALGDRKKFLNNLLGTIILGTAFLLAVVLWEWPIALDPAHGTTPDTPYGAAFFAMTGMHAFHVLTGVLMLILVYLNGRKGAYSESKHWGVEAVVKYWHMVDLVWVFFYPVLYLIQ
jgi:cytochrome c oxidase subunit 3